MVPKYSLKAFGHDTGTRVVLLVLVLIVQYSSRTSYGCKSFTVLLLLLLLLSSRLIMLTIVCRNHSTCVHGINLLRILWQDIAQIYDEFCELPCLCIIFPTLYNFT